ncbi:hypothetical protein LCGC14_0264290 [marine sediment metagenome]|uniref:Uncharacterized protein n=1 Tax=marine sediment metagenome TaxID=412755 RepID=A0A0F9UHQ1_9ZZZZ
MTKETKIQKDKRLQVGLYEPDTIRDVRKEYEYIKDRLPPMWTAVFTVNFDAKLCIITLKNGSNRMMKRIYRDDIWEYDGYYDKSVYTKHVKWAWKRFQKEGC